jgi:hypothetical protein
MSKRETKLSKACKVVFDALRNDEDYYRSWKDNIAMTFYDEYRRTGNKLPYYRVHLVANEAAKNFLDLLIRED